MYCIFKVSQDWHKECPRIDGFPSTHAWHQSLFLLKCHCTLVSQVSDSITLPLVHTNKVIVMFPTKRLQREKGRCFLLLWKFKNINKALNTGFGWWSELPAFHLHSRFHPVASMPIGWFQFLPDTPQQIDREFPWRYPLLQCPKGQQCLTAVLVLMPYAAQVRVVFWVQVSSCQTDRKWFLKYYGMLVKVVPPARKGRHVLLCHWGEPMASRNSKIDHFKVGCPVIPESHICRPIFSEFNFTFKRKPFEIP